MSTVYPTIRSIVSTRSLWIHHSALSFCIRLHTVHLDKLPHNATDNLPSNIVSAPCRRVWTLSNPLMGLPSNIQLYQINLPPLPQDPPASRLTAPPPTTQPFYHLRKVLLTSQAEHTLSLLPQFLGMATTPPPSLKIRLW